MPAKSPVTQPKKAARKAAKSTAEASAKKTAVRSIKSLSTGARGSSNSKSKSSSQRQKIVNSASPSRAKAKAGPVRLLSGDNPQIPKGDGDAPVQAYIAAIPGWKQDVARRLDALIVRRVPRVEKAIRWNSPFYGLPGKGWFLSFHCFTKYIKVTFFRGTSLRPVPPAESKHDEVRYLDIREGEFDEAQTSRWIRQAAALPGWIP